MVFNGVFGNKDKLPKIQLAAIIIVVVYFFAFGAALSAAYGGFISLVNTGLINRHTNKQTTAPAMSAQTSVVLMFVSVITRMAVVIGLTLAGFELLKLNSNALIAGLVFGLIGFLIDKVLQK